MSRREEGTVTLLTAGLLTLVLLVLVGVSQVARTFLAQRSLAGACDAAALAAAQGVDLASLYRGEVAQPSPAEARSRLRAFLALPGALADAPGATVTLTSADAGAVRLACTRPVALPLGRVIGLTSVTVRARAVARVQ